MTGHLVLLLAADRAHSGERTKVRKALLAAGFEAGGRTFLEKKTSPENLDAAVAVLQHLHGKHPGVRIQARYIAEWTLK